MATIQYSENIQIRSGLQADTRDHKAKEAQTAKVLVYDILINAISDLPVTHGGINDKQVYYSPTINRKSAYHGAFIKQFSLFGDFNLIIGGSLDHQYPLEVYLTYRGLLVQRLYTFKSSSRAITNELLPSASELSERFANRLNQINFDLIAPKIDGVLNSEVVFSKHWRKFKKECLGVMEYLGI